MIRTAAFVPDDLYRLRLVGSPAIVGDEVVAVVQSADAESGTYRGRLARFTLRAGQAAGSGANEPDWLTEAGAWSDSQPVASPDGKIAFISTRPGQPTACVIDALAPAVPTQPAEPTQPAGPAQLAGPDAPVTALAWYDAVHLIAHVERPVPAASDHAPVHVSWLRYKSDGRAGFIEPHSELWLLGLDGSARLVHRSAGRITQFAVSGQHVVAVVEPRHSDDLEPVTEVRLIDPADEPGAPGQLAWSVRAQVGALLVTSKSARLVAVTSGVSGQSVDLPRLWAIGDDGTASPLVTGQVVDCERAIISDCRPSGQATLLRPVAGSDEVLYLDAAGDEQAVWVADPATGSSRRLSPAGWSVTDFSAAADGQVALCLESATAPTELFVAPVSGDRPVTALSRLNDTGGRAVQPEPVQVTARDGVVLRGLLYRAAAPGAPARQADASPRLLIRVHGGPHASFGNTFDLETQTMVAAGFSVLAPNIRGSAGREPEFRALSVGQWGRADYDDLMAFTDWAVASGAGREDALYLAGGSYGGYLINWALTRTSRFRAAVSERSISNMVSKYGTADNGFTTNRFEFGGLDLFAESATELLDRSPIRHADRIVTPLLLLHGEADYRCPIEQSEQLFVALRRLGRECEFVRFPGASHAFGSSGRPDHRVERLELILDWLRRH